MLGFWALRLPLLRRLGAIVLAMAAIIIWVTMGSPEKSAGAYLSDIRTVIGRDRLNQSTAESAPQQTVVNGWTARDLLAVSDRISAANTRDDDRIGAELMLLILAVCWWMLTTPRGEQPIPLRGSGLGQEVSGFVAEASSKVGPTKGDAAQLG